MRGGRAKSKKDRRQRLSLRIRPLRFKHSPGVGYTDDLDRRLIIESILMLPVSLLSEGCLRYVIEVSLCSRGGMFRSYGFDSEDHTKQSFVQ